MIYETVNLKYIGGFLYRIRGNLYDIGGNLYYIRGNLDVCGFLYYMEDIV